ncbi:hypothetical protein FRC06_002820, partial [Ceratobasidium sp. 370]
HGQIKLAVRPIVEYGLDFLKWNTSPAATNKNIQIFSLVHPNAFHCLEFQPAYGHYKSSLVTKSIAATLFNGPNSVSATFCEYFDPMPLTTVAFILATPITLHNEVRPDTLISDDDDEHTTSHGHSESEDMLSSADDEPEIDGDDRYTAKAKGKGRA